MSGFSFLTVPQLAINGYLWDTMKAINPNLETIYGTKFPFYPIGDSASGSEPWDERPYFVYDRVFRFATSPFYPKKRESFLYYLKAREVDTIEWSAALQLILDREDDAAKDINDWIRSQGPNDDYDVYFHNLRVYQSRSGTASSTSQLRESTVQPFYISEFMVDTCYHFTKSLEDYFI